MLSIWHQHIHSFYLIYLCWTKSIPIHTAFRYSWIFITNRMNGLFHCGYLSGELRFAPPFTNTLYLHSGHPVFSIPNALHFLFYLAFGIKYGAKCKFPYLSISAGIFVVRVEASECWVMTAGLTRSTSITMYCPSRGIWLVGNNFRCVDSSIFNHLLSEIGNL